MKLTIMNKKNNSTMQHVKVFAATFEDEAAKQVNQLASLDAYKDSIIRIMPDAHAGKGCTIGTTMTIKDKITPNLVGVDIGCGMLVVPLEQKITDFDAFDKHLREVMPAGFAVNETPTCNVEVEREMLEQLVCKNAFDMDYTLCSLGTLGGGNHFVEIDEDEEGKQYLVIHTGSRNLGVKVANHYQKIADKQCSQSENLNEVIAQMKAEGRHKEIADVVKSMKKCRVPKDLAYVSGQAFDDYIHDMKICQQYAIDNRMLIAERLLGNRDWWVSQYFCTIHNYIDTKHMIMRKGAVSARQGERLIIPMNMRDGSLICIGLGNDDWNQSAPHGAGRLMSRAEAKRTLHLDDFKKSMDGIYTTSADLSTIDEAPMAYKSSEEIMSCIIPTVRIEHVIKPVYNFKAQG